MSSKVKSHSTNCEVVVGSQNPTLRVCSRGERVVGSCSCKFVVRSSGRERVIKSRRHERDVRSHVTRGLLKFMSVGAVGSLV